MGLAHFLDDDALIRGWREGSNFVGRPRGDTVVRRGEDGFLSGSIVGFGFAGGGCRGGSADHL